MNLFLDRKFVISICVFSILIACTTKKTPKNGQNSPKGKVTQEDPLKKDQDVTPDNKDDSQNKGADTEESATTADPDTYLTGGVNELGLNYIDLSNDGILGILKGRASAVSASNKASIQDFADSIYSAELIVIENKVQVDLSLIPPGKADRKKVFLTGTLAPSKKMPSHNRIAFLKGDGIGLSITGELRCIDLDPASCETSFLRVALSTPNGTRRVAIIFRNSHGNLHYNVKDSSTNLRDLDIKRAEFRKTLLRSTIEGESAGGDIFKAIELQSFAVVYGRSGFKFRLLSNQNRIVSMSGPLVDLSNTSAKIKLSDRLSDEDIYPDFDSKNQNGIIRSTYFQDLITNGELIKTAGPTEPIVVTIDMDDKDKNIEFGFRFTFTRVSKPTIEMNEKLLYFAP